MADDNHAQLRSELARSWGGPATSVSPELEALAQERLRRYRPTVWKKILAWASVIFGGFALLSSTGDLFTDGLGYAVGSVLLSASFALPGAYWFTRYRDDARTITSWMEKQETHDRLAGVLRGSELDLLGRRPAPPMLPKRRWGTVIGSGAALFMVGALFLPSS